VERAVRRRGRRGHVRSPMTVLDQHRPTAVCTPSYGWINLASSTRLSSSANRIARAYTQMISLQAPTRARALTHARTDAAANL
jgi:hypothetical protein